MSRSHPRNERLGRGWRGVKQRARKFLQGMSRQGVSGSWSWSEAASATSPLSPFSRPLLLLLFRELTSRCFLYRTHSSFCVGQTTEPILEDINTERFYFFSVDNTIDLIGGCIEKKHPLESSVGKVKGNTSTARQDIQTPPSTTINPI